MSPEEFIDCQLLPNQYVLLPSVPDVPQWQISENIGKSGLNQAVLNVFGSCSAPVTDSAKVKCGEPCVSSSLFTFSNYLERLKSNRFLYFKDFHFTRDVPLYTAYTWPLLFQSDWLNEYYDYQHWRKDDYRFMYYGPVETWTPLHTDVLRSNSWSVNIVGRKLWYLFPPDVRPRLSDSFGNLVTDCLDRYQVKPIEITQGPGEFIFVPSGWLHQVHNLETTLSINHNWFNAFNVLRIWEYLSSEMLAVEEQIADCRDMDNWHDQCQIILKASAGFDFHMFIDLLVTVLKNRFLYIIDNSSSICLHASSVVERFKRHQLLDSDFPFNLSAEKLTALLSHFQKEKFVEHFGAAENERLRNHKAVMLKNELFQNAKLYMLTEASVLNTYIVVLDIIRISQVSRLLVSHDVIKFISTSSNNTNLQVLSAFCYEYSFGII